MIDDNIEQSKRLTLLNAEANREKEIFSQNNAKEIYSINKK